MKQQVAAGIIAVALVGGSATGLIVRSVRSDAAEPASASPTTAATTATPKPSPSPDETSGAPSAEKPSGGTGTAQAPSKPALLPLGSMQITTGAVGPVSVGMTKEQAAATGYFNVDVPSENCPTATPLEWTSNYTNALDLFLTQDARISSIGVRGTGPKTRSGLAINSTYAQVRAVIGADRTPEEAGYGQTGLFVNDGDAWIGFLFDVQPGSIQDSDVVTFIEVTRGAKPGLVRDGC